MIYRFIRILALAMALLLLTYMFALAEESATVVKDKLIPAANELVETLKGLEVENIWSLFS